MYNLSFIVITLKTWQIFILNLSVHFSVSVVSDSLQPRGQQHTRFTVHHQLPELAQTHVHQLGDDIQPSHSLPSPSRAFSRPLLLMPSIFPSIRVFSNESVLLHQVAKVLGFSFSTSPSNEYSGLFPLGLTDWISL